VGRAHLATHPEERKRRDKHHRARKGADAGYAPIWRSRLFPQDDAAGFFNYGGLVAMQTLWAGPWMIRVAGYTPLEAATGLFYINASMLVTFWSWGMVNPWLARQGWMRDAPDHLGRAVQPCGAGLQHRRRQLHRLAGLGAVLHGQQRPGPGAARGGHGFQALAGGPGAVGLQPHDFCRRVHRAVGHWPLD
jgi:hypothetical protein